MKTARSTFGFTLIELLIVIAIILILIAIALPNFLEAQIRAKVAKAKGNARTIATAMETYLTDFGVYPTDHDPDDTSQQGLRQLTTPLQYLAIIPEEPFATSSGIIGAGGEIGWEMASTGFPPLMIAFGGRPKINAFGLASFGPDIQDSFPCGDRWTVCVSPATVDPCTNGDGTAWTDYAPTNGTKSYGDIMQLGGEISTGNYCVNGWQRVKGYMGD